MAVQATRHEVDLFVECLYREHARAVKGVALRVIRDPSEAEDIVQSTFLSAYRALLRGAVPREPRKWLLAIATNLARRQLQEVVRRRREVALDSEALEAPEGGHGPTATDFRRAVERLSPKQQEALILREVHGLSYAELKERLDLSPPALQVLLFRARAALRDVLDGREQELSCAQVPALVQRQLDGEASVVEKRQLKVHLRVCSTCPTSARSLRARVARLNRLQALTLPWGLLQRLGVLAENSESHKLVLKVALGLAATAAAGVAVGTGRLPIPTEPPPSAAAPAHVSRGPSPSRHASGTRLQAQPAGENARRVAVPWNAARRKIALSGGGVGLVRSSAVSQPLGESSGREPIPAIAQPSDSEPAPATEPPPGPETTLPAAVPSSDPPVSSAPNQSGDAQAGIDQEGATGPPGGTPLPVGAPAPPPSPPPDDLTVKPRRRQFPTGRGRDPVANGTAPAPPPVAQTQGPESPVTTDPAVPPTLPPLSTPPAPDPAPVPTDVAVEPLEPPTTEPPTTSTDPVTTAEEPGGPKLKTRH